MLTLFLLSRPGGHVRQGQWLIKLANYEGAGRLGATLRKVCVIPFPTPVPRSVVPIVVGVYDYL